MKIFVYILILFISNSWASPNQLNHLQWIDKVATTLRQGKGLSHKDPITQLKTMSNDEVIEYFLNHDDFLNTLLDFNNYFLGHKVGSLIDTTKVFPNHIHIKYSRTSLHSYQAIAAVKEYAKEGNYFKLLSAPDSIMYLSPNFDPWLFDENGNIKYITDPAEQFTYRERLKQDHLNRLKELNDFVQLNGQSKFDRKKFCELVFNTTGFVNNQVALNDFEWFSAYECRAHWDHQKLLAIVPDINRFVNNIYPLIHSISPHNYVLKNPLDIKEFDRNTFNFTKKRMARYFFADAIPNSSTNYNRKRAAYYLNTFFCDDLTPLNIELPTNPNSTDEHAQNPACMSCHYRLDPMAGFFRNYGINGADMSDREEILFDDLARMPLSDYVKAWKSSNGQRKWNVGYIRSSKDEGQNSYGSTLEDLYRIINNADEVKRCFVKRALNYFVATKQTFDAGLVEHFTAKLINDTKTNSTLALKSLIKSILKTNSFKQIDPIQGQCYDYAPGTIPKNRPPCKVAAIIETNCVKCHKSTGGAGNLDLSKWIANGHGDLSFPHLDDDGMQKTKKETFELIQERINSSDRSFQMPPNGKISVYDRTEIFKWVNQVLQDDI